MLKWYLRIYIFIEYLKCVLKSNYISIIRNDSKKKKKSEDRVPGSRFGLRVGSGTAARAVTSLSLFFGLRMMKEHAIMHRDACSLLSFMVRGILDIS